MSRPLRQWAVTVIIGETIDAATCAAHGDQELTEMLVALRERGLSLRPSGRGFTVIEGRGALRGVPSPFVPAWTVVEGGNVLANVTPARIVRMKVDLDPKATEVLERLTKSTGLSVDDVIRRALVALGRSVP